MAEKIKNAAIFLLSLSMIFLLVTTLKMAAGESVDFFALFSGEVTDATAGPGGEGGSLLPGMCIFPSQIAIVGSGGVYSPLGNEAYEDALAAILGIYSEALGSSGKPDSITEKEYIGLLGGPAIYLQFDVALPFYLHHAWAELEASAVETRVESIVVCGRGDFVEIAFSAGQEGYFALSTASSSAKLRELCGLQLEPNCAFAFSLPSNGGLKADQLVYSGVLRLQRYALESPYYVGASELPFAVLEAFSMRPNLARFFISGTGAMEYVEGDGVLRSGLAGELSYTAPPRAAAESGLAPGSTGEGIAMCETARRMVDSVWKATGSTGRLSLSLFEYDEAKDAYYIGFDMQLGGLYVARPLRAAHVTIEGGAVTSVSVRPVSARGEDTLMIAYSRYIAAASGLEEGRAAIVYSVGDDGMLSPAVSVVREESDGLEAG